MGRGIGAVSHRGVPALHGLRPLSGRPKVVRNDHKGRRAVAGQGRRMTGFGVPVAASPWPGRVGIRHVDDGGSGGISASQLTADESGCQTLG